jgi:hypothetical protein
MLSEVPRKTRREKEQHDPELCLWRLQEKDSSHSPIQREEVRLTMPDRTLVTRTRLHMAEPVNGTIRAFRTVESCQRQEAGGTE